MKVKIRNIILAVATMLALSTPALVPAVAAAASGNNNTVSIQDNLCSGSNLDLSQQKTSGCDKTSASDLSTLLITIVNIISVIVGVVAVIMIIIGGFKYITSGGESGNVSGAKNTIIYAVIGLVVVALAQFIVHFVLSQTSSLG